MLGVTSARHAKWDVVAAEHKHFARAAALETIVRRIEEGMRRNGFEPPASHGSDYSG
jgi:polyphosphate kinase 2 (PPK2 family)